MATLNRDELVTILQTYQDVFGNPPANVRKGLGVAIGGMQAFAGHRDLATCARNLPLTFRCRDWYLRRVLTAWQGVQILTANKVGGRDVAKIVLEYLGDEFVLST